mmetsp:Transcript_3807/g.9991  ORF Transcript_3807/g.9991 Transcript_3807/m.9991 type:complete len:917 (+) Transcript_3807:110-2860(+)
MGKSRPRKKAKRTLLPSSQSSQSLAKKPKNDYEYEYESAKTNRNKNVDLHLPQVFPNNLPLPPKGSFLRNEPPYEDSFKEAINGPYEGFVVDKADVLTSPSMSADEYPSIEEKEIQLSLEKMKREGFFRIDVTQPFGLGTKCAKTYVTRCLVGNPGTTYKYLGLRMFSHPWKASTTKMLANDPHSKRKKKHKERLNQRFADNDIPTKNERAIVENTSTIRELSEALTNRTAMHLRNLDNSRRRRRALATKGRPDFDICLINRMESSSDLKPFYFDGNKNDRGAIANCESHHNFERSKHGENEGAKTSVSWHADSSLEHYSTIAVYQTILRGSTIYKASEKVNETKEKKSANNEKKNGQWWVAMRVAHHAEGPQASQKRMGVNTESSIVEETPSIAVSLPSGSAYYLLDDFNHHHQHTVLTTGNAEMAGIRYSCTFRLLRDSHNVQDWIDRGNGAIRQFHKKGPKIWRSEQLLLTEIESEWIRQFYIQGSENKIMLWEPYWKTAIEKLLSIWSQLEFRTKQTIDLLRAAAEERCGTDMSVNNDSEKTNVVDRRPTKAERKARDRRKKSLEKIQELISRIGSNGDKFQYSTMKENADGEIAYNELYQPFAKLLDERAEMRELWARREKDHVFHDLTPDCRPIEVPFKWELSQPGDESNIPGLKSFGESPLPQSPGKLKAISRQLLQCGQAFREGEVSLLPPVWTTVKPESEQRTDEESTEHSHSKPIDWSGWNSVDQIFGLELQNPWAGLVVDGKKSIETRSYALPPSLIGKKIMIIESCSGQAGVSSLGNCISLSQTETDRGTKIIGWCIFSSIKEYTTGKDFRAEENQHLVTQDSGYGWKEGKTKTVYGWIVKERYRYNRSSSSASIYDVAVRRYRSIFQLHRRLERVTNEKKRGKRHRDDKKERKKEKKRKRKRF